MPTEHEGFTSYDFSLERIYQRMLNEEDPEKRHQLAQEVLRKTREQVRDRMQSSEEHETEPVSMSYFYFTVTLIALVVGIVLGILLTATLLPLL